MDTKRQVRRMISGIIFRGNASLLSCMKGRVYKCERDPHRLSYINNAPIACHKFKFLIFRQCQRKDPTLASVRDDFSKRKLTFSLEQIQHQLSDIALAAQNTCKHKYSAKEVQHLQVNLFTI